MNRPVVATLDDVTVRYAIGAGQVTALSAVSLQFTEGSSTAVIGRSGSGKSTLISVLSLLRRPTAGRVIVGNTEAVGLSDAELSSLRSRFVGTVFQSFHLDPGFTAVENAMLPWFFGSGMRRRSALDRARELLNLLDIGDLAARYPTQMSGGQRQRVAICRALFMEPALLVADEPTGNLDETTAGAMADVLYDLPRQTSTAVVVVTHDRDVAFRAQRCVQLVRGSIESVGPTPGSATSDAVERDV